VDKDTVTLRVRERLDAGTLPRAIPPLTTEPGRPTSPVGTIKADTGIGVVRCAACDELGAQVAYRFPDGRILRFHGRCHGIWKWSVNEVRLAEQNTRILAQGPSRGVQTRSGGHVEPTPLTSRWRAC